MLHESSLGWMRGAAATARGRYSAEVVDARAYSRVHVDREEKIGAPYLADDAEPD